MADKPSWQDVYGGKLPDSLPAVPRNDTPYVHDPACARDCTGRHGVDRVIRFVTCQVPAYQVWSHEYKVNRGVNFHTLIPMNGAPQLYSADMPCPVCKGTFQA